jgi:hypothetical protein
MVSTPLLCRWTIPRLITGIPQLGQNLFSSQKRQVLPHLEHTIVKGSPQPEQ